MIDDGSSDSTWDALQEFAGDGVTLVRHEANAGYARTFAHLIDRCGTDYFMLANDDDGVDADNLRRLGSWLPVERPDFVSTAHGGVSSPTRPARPTQPIDYVEFRAASAHGPGLVFRRSATIEPLAFLREELDKGNAAAIVYPQVVVAAWLCTEGSAWWWSEALTWEADSLAPGLRDPSGLPYTAPAARLSQALGFNQMLWDLAQRSPTSDGAGPRPSTARTQRPHALPRTAQCVRGGKRAGERPYARRRERAPAGGGRTEALAASEIVSQPRPHRRRRRRRTPVGSRCVPGGSDARLLRGSWRRALDGQRVDRAAQRCRADDGPWFRSAGARTLRRAQPRGPVLPSPRRSSCGTAPISARWWESCLRHGACGRVRCSSTRRAMRFRRTWAAGSLA